MQGRRVEKKPAAKKPEGSKKGPIIAVAVVGVVLAAYLGLCAWVGASDKIMPNVYVLGVDVSGMTEQEAQAAVDQNLDAYGDQVSATNVLVLETDIHVISGDTYGRLAVDLTGGGKRTCFCGGKSVPIRWSKASRNDPLVYTTEDGAPLTLGQGTSYVCIVNPKTSTLSVS